MRHSGHPPARPPLLFPFLLPSHPRCEKGVIVPHQTTVKQGLRQRSCWQNGSQCVVPAARTHPSHFNPPPLNPPPRYISTFKYVVICSKRQNKPSTDTDRPSQSDHANLALPRPTSVKMLFKSKYQRECSDTAKLIPPSPTCCHYPTLDTDTLHLSSFLDTTRLAQTLKLKLF